MMLNASISEIIKYIILKITMLALVLFIIWAFTAIPVI
jgi:hypothetical protein